MPTFAAMVARQGSRWRSCDVDLSDVDDIDAIVDLMRDCADDASTVVLFVEQDDEWFAIVRTDETGEPRVFISDARMVAVSDLAAILFEDQVTPDVVEEADAALAEEDTTADDDEPAVKPLPEPRGAVDLLADFDISASDLLAMSAEEGALPADVIAAVCDRLGCADEVEVYR